MFTARLAQLIPAGQRVAWMAPSSQKFKAAVPEAGITNVDFHDGAVDASYFTTESPTTIVVSAQPVTKAFLEAWRNKLPEASNTTLTLIRRGTSLGSIDTAAAKELSINVVNTPGVNSPHVARFAVDYLFGAEEGRADRVKAMGEQKVVVFGAGSVGGFVVRQLNELGVKPVVVNPSPLGEKGITENEATQEEASDALVGATHIVVCCATAGEPVLTEPLIDALIGADRKDRAIRICCLSRPEAFSLAAILKLPETAVLRFDYGPAVLAPMKEKVDAAGNPPNISWSSAAMASEACKEDMDEAVLAKLASA